MMNMYGSIKKVSCMFMAVAIAVQASLQPVMATGVLIDTLLDTQPFYSASVTPDQQQNVTQYPTKKDLLGFVDAATDPVINGVCGSADSIPTEQVPMQSELCESGMPTPVTTESNQYSRWCIEDNGGKSENCAAPRIGIPTVQSFEKKTITKVTTVIADPWTNGWCIDTDMDMICDPVDNCPTIANWQQQDVDFDGVGDVCDNCKYTTNADQANSDGDAEWDVCDFGDQCRDQDNDTICDKDDNCVSVPNADQADADGDKQGDACEPFVCKSPITSLTLTSPRTVASQTVLLTWLVQWWVKEIVVIVWSAMTMYPATITNGVWSATVSFPVVGKNDVWVKATPTVASCGLKQLDLQITYTPAPVCVDPITSFTLTTDVNGKTVQSSSLTLTGTISWGVQQVVVMVGNTPYTGTITNGIWTATVQLVSWTNTMRIKALPKNALCTAWQKDLVVYYQPKQECINEITTFTINSHVWNQTVSSRSVLLTWTIVWGVKKIDVMVWVNLYNAVITNTTWSVTLPLSTGANSIWLKAYPNDTTCNEIQRDITLNYNPETPKTVCLETKVTPAEVMLSGGSFTVLCSGTNVQSYKVQVTQPNWFITFINTPVGGTTNQFSFVPGQVGRYEFACQAKGYNDTICPSTAGTVTTIIPECPDPITTLQVTSHTNNQAIIWSVVPVFSGRVDGNVTKVEVTIWNSTYTDTTIVNGVWSIDDLFLPVIGKNAITLKAYHGNGKEQCAFINFFELTRSKHTIITTCTDTQVTPAQIALNQWTFTIACQWTNVTTFDVKVTRPDQTTTTVSLLPGNTTMTLSGSMTGTYLFQCVAQGWTTAYCPTATGMVVTMPWVCIDQPTNLTIDSHLSGQVVNTATTTITGRVAGAVEKVEVMLGTTVYTATITNGVWSVVVPVAVGINSIWVKAYPTDKDCSPIQKDLFVKHYPNICTDEITSLTVTSHINNQLMHTWTITLTGSVQWGVEKIEVMLGNTLYRATIANSVWTVIVPLSSWANSIWVKAYPNDTDCSPVQKDLVLRYQPTPPVTMCFATVVTPTTVQLHNNFFTITCQWTNVLAYKLQVTHPNGFISHLTTPVNSTGNVFQFVPTVEGTYEFVCHAEGYNDTICPSAGAVVTKSTTWECTLPLNYLNIDTPLSGSVTTSGTIVVEGTVLPSANVQTVTVNGVTATITGSAFSAIVPVAMGVNKIVATATSKDGDCANLSDETTIIRQPVAQCDYILPPDAVTITTPLSGAVFTTGTIQLSGTRGAGVATVTVKVNGATVATFGSTTATGWTTTIALANGKNTIEVIGAPADLTCASVTKAITVTYNKPTDNVCDNPLALTVSSPASATTTSQSSITVQGVVTGTNVVLKVGNTTVVPNASGFYTFEYALAAGSNTITVTATNGDDDCTKTISLSVTRRTGGGWGGRRSSIICGNARLDSGEQCDDGNSRNGDGCNNVCQWERRYECGNNRIESNETCDDWNNRNGDGCSSVCKLEDIGLKEKIVKKVKARPQPISFVAPKILPKTGVLRGRPTPGRTLRGN